jgi:hypothetical protein
MSLPTLTNPRSRARNNAEHDQKPPLHIHCTPFHAAKLTFNPRRQPTRRNQLLYFYASITGFLNTGLKRLLKSSQSLLVRRHSSSTPRDYCRTSPNFPRPAIARGSEIPTPPRSSSTILLNAAAAETRNFSSYRKSTHGVIM